MPSQRAGTPNPWVTLRALRVVHAYPRRGELLDVGELLDMGEPEGLP